MIGFYMMAPLAFNELKEFTLETESQLEPPQTSKKESFSAIANS